MLRQIRRWSGRAVTDLSLAAAHRLPTHWIDGLEWFAARVGTHLPIVSTAVTENMHALGVYSLDARRQYFGHVAAHLTSALRIFKAHAIGTPAARAALFAEIHRRFQLDASCRLLEEVARQKRGAVVMGPHLGNFVFALARLNEVAPLTIYMRWSKHPGRHEAKRRWCETTGMRWIIEPPEQSRPSGRLAALVSAVREGHILYITPDLVRKRGDGAPVRFFDREIYLPAGACVLATRAEAPLYLLLGRQHAGGIELSIRGPAPSDGGRERVREVVAERMQWFAEAFERFVREQPGLWYSWADKRWTRLLHGDRELFQPLTEPRAAISTPDAAVQAG